MRRTVPTTDKQNRLASSDSCARRHEPPLKQTPFFYSSNGWSVSTVMENRTLPDICRSPQGDAGDPQTIRERPARLSLPAERRLFSDTAGAIARPYLRAAPYSPVAAARRPHRSPTARNLRFLLPGTPKRSRRVRSANGSETENRSRSRRGHRIISFRKTRTYRNRSRTSDSGCSPQQRR